MNINELYRSEPEPPPLPTPEELKKMLPPPLPHIVVIREETVITETKHTFPFMIPFFWLKL